MYELIIFCFICFLEINNYINNRLKYLDDENVY